MDKRKKAPGDMPRAFKVSELNVDVLLLFFSLLYSSNILYKVSHQ